MVTVQDSFSSNFDNEEFEDVPSPFRKKTTARPSARPTNTRGNMFSRPMGTSPSEAPTVVEQVTRRTPGRPEQTEFLNPRRRNAAAPSIDYLDEEVEEEEIEEDEEEEVTERRVTVAKPRAKTKVKPKVDLLPRIGWGIVGVLMLRLIFMERGVIDYMGMNGKIKDSQQELSRVKNENAEIGTEIRRISLDKSYQRQLAKEHLGVIAADEFLILFAGESAESENEADRPL
jgi:cell division protein FtsB